MMGAGWRSPATAPRGSSWVIRSRSSIRFFDGNARVHARGIVKIDVIHAWPAKGIGQRSFDEGGPAVETQERPVRIPERAKFYRQDSLLAAAPNGLANERWLVAILSRSEDASAP
jgi:hypothetical protein